MSYNDENNELLCELMKEVKALKEIIKELSSKPSPTVIRGIDGLAEFLGVGKNTAQKMKNNSVIPYYQYGRVVLFKPDEVLDSIKKNTPKYNR